MNDKQQLNKILNDIKNGIDRKNDLLMNDRIMSAIKGISGSYAEEKNFEYDDVFQNAIIEFYDLLRTYTFYEDDNNLSKTFIGYLNKYLTLRLNDYYDTYSMFRNSNDVNVVSLESFDNYEFLNEDLQVEEIDNNFIDLIATNNFYDKLSFREKQVYDLLKEGYDDGYISNELGISFQHIYSCKKRISKKIK